MNAHVISCKTEKKTTRLRCWMTRDNGGFVRLWPTSLKQERFRHKHSLWQYTGGELWQNMRYFAEYDGPSFKKHYTGIIPKGTIRRVLIYLID